MLCFVRKLFKTAEIKSLSLWKVADLITFVFSDFAVTSSKLFPMLPISSQTSWQFPVRSSWTPTVLLTQVPLHPQLCTVHSWVLALKRALGADWNVGTKPWFSHELILLLNGDIIWQRNPKERSFFSMLSLHLGSWSTFQKCGSDLRIESAIGMAVAHYIPFRAIRAGRVTRSEHFQTFPWHVRYVSCVIIRSSRWQRHYVKHRLTSWLSP